MGSYHSKTRPLLDISYFPGSDHRMEQKRKLFHTSVYESEVQLKKLYIQTCRRLPAHGCKVYQVKELLRGKTKKKAARLLGVGPDKIVLLDNKTKILAKSQNTSDLIQWRTGGGRSHDRLQLEFRSSRWSLVVPSVADMRQVGLALWEILQELDCTFLEEHTLLSRFPNQDLVKRTVPLQVLHSAELEELQRLLHFPEEVALRLADSENELFYQVPPIDYLRQVTLDLGGSPAQAGDTPRASVRALVKRFNEVTLDLGGSPAQAGDTPRASVRALVKRSMRPQPNRCTHVNVHSHTR
ncbi:hypothetical protein J6590_001335 [Homalodisca vitripennis]|nr:hypothetical protein J6590_001335 [Homalodisca vitripennis]